MRLLAAALVALAALPAATASAGPFEGRRCTPPAGHRIAALDGRAFYASRVNIRGRGCAVSADQSVRLPTRPGRGCTAGSRAAVRHSFAPSAVVAYEP